MDKLAEEYGWQKFGCFYVYDTENGSFLLNEDEFSYQCGCCSRKTFIKTDLQKRLMEQIQVQGLNALSTVILKI